MTGSVLPVTVVVPTIGRPDRLRTCLASLAACSPRAEEVLVVDQSGAAEVAAVVAEHSGTGACLVPCDGRGVSRGRNTGLRAAVHDIVLVTDDDCTVARDWVACAAAASAVRPFGIVTGRVLPVGDPEAVPSWKDDGAPHDFTGEVHAGALFPNNMVVDRRLVLAEGGFDERFGPAEAAEDNEFCYRWLRAGRPLRYEPALVVWHHDWRTAKELERLYVAYARGQGFFYAKHLRRRDMTMLRYLLRDLGWAVRGLVAAALRPRPAPDPRAGIVRGLPVGLARGWRAYRSERG